jgi:hypothetical protein
VTVVKDFPPNGTSAPRLLAVHDVVPGPPERLESGAAYCQNKFDTLHQLWVPNWERELHSECDLWEKEGQVLISSLHDGGDRHRENIRTHPSN